MSGRPGPGRDAGGGEPADRVGMGEGLAVGCGLGALLALAATWLALGPLTGNWVDCNAEPGQKFLVVLLLPVLVLVHFAAFGLGYAVFRRQAGWGTALALAVLALAVVAIVVGQVLLALHGLSGELCTEPF